MSPIEQALTNLDAVVGKLEHAIGHYEKASTSRLTKAEEKAKKAQIQSDMFAKIDPAIVAKKLDTAIQKVETVLAESQG